MKKTLLQSIYLLFLASIFSTNPAAAETIFLYPAADTMISGRWPFDIYGASTGLMVGRTSNAEPNALHTRIRFSGIPSSVDIQSAELRLYRTMGSGSHTLSVQSASSSWSENTLTWNSSGSTNRWTTPNSTYSMSNQTGYVYVDVTSHVQEWADGTRTNYGFHLSSDGTMGENHTFASRESSTSSYRPRLEITYSPLPPDPDLISVDIPSSASVGEPFTVTVTAENDGGTSPEGAITASVLYSDGTDNIVVNGPNASWADGTYNRAPGYYPIYNNSCQAMTAQDYMLEVVDSNWQNGESHSMSFTVTPQEEGSLYVRVRTTMRNGAVEDCDYRNDTSSSGGSTGTDQQGLSSRVYTVTVAKRDSAEIVQFNPPTGTLQRGDITQATVVVKNTGSNRRSFWVGLSFWGPMSEEWPNGWLDVPPIQTPELDSAQQTTVNFDLFIPGWLPQGGYGAITAIWPDYDPYNHLMQPPRFDEKTDENSFILEVPPDANDLVGRILFPPDRIDDLSSSYRFTHQFYREYLVNPGPFDGAKIQIEKINPIADGDTRLSIIISKNSDDSAVDKIYGKDHSQLLLVIPNDVTISGIKTKIDGDVREWQEYAELAIAFLVPNISDVIDINFLAAKVVDSLSQKALIAGFYKSTDVLNADVPVDLQEINENQLLAIDFDFEKWGQDINYFSEFEIQFDIKFIGPIKPITVISDIRYETFPFDQLGRIDFSENRWAFITRASIDGDAIPYPNEEFRKEIDIYPNSLVTSHIYYKDNDDDGYGDLNSPVEATSQPAGYVSNGSDCNDDDSSIYPGATEINDGVDNDCDGIIDEGYEISRVIRLGGNLFFGNVSVGQTSQKSLTIWNDGNSTLNITGIACPTGFSGNWSGPIAAGSSRNVTVTFSPQAGQNYSGNVTVNSDKTGGTNTLQCSGTGVQQDTVSNPILSPNGGSYPGNSVDVTVSCSTDGATIRYTTNGNEPNESSPTIFSGESVTVSVPGTLKAKAWKEGMLPSATATANYSAISDMINVALQANGGIATAGSVGTYLGVSHPASSANDDNETSDWCNSWLMPDWLKIEFDEAYVISEVGVVWGVGAHNQTYSISLSEDGVNWQVVVPSCASATDAGDDGGYHGNTTISRERFTVTPTIARFIRIDVTGTSAPGSHIFKAIVHELQAFSVNTSETVGLEWLELTNTLPWMKRIWHTSLCFDGKIWVFGGFGEDSSGRDVLYSDVWNSSDGTNWNLVTDSAPWGGRAGHTSVVFDNKIWIIGGVRRDSGSGDGSDVWYSNDGLNWTQANANSPFGQRHHHSSVVFDNKIWIFGGLIGPGNDTDQPTSDVWNCEDGITWNRVVELSPWSPRANHTSLVYNNKIWIIGGSTGQGEIAIQETVSDIWSSTNGIQWTQVKESSNWVPRILNTCAVYDNKMWLIGGIINDTAYSMVSDVWFSSDGTNWYLETDSSDWGKRAGHSTVVCDNKLFILGGIGGENLSNLEFKTDVFSSISLTLVGDINDDGYLDLKDSILALQVISGLKPAGIRTDYTISGTDVSSDNKIGLEEVVFILHKASGQR